MCGVERDEGCGVGGGLGVLSIGVCVDWGCVGVVVGVVSIAVMVEMVMDLIVDVLGVSVFFVGYFLQLLRFPILLMLVFCPAKFCFHLSSPGLVGWILSSYRLCL